MKISFLTIILSLGLLSSQAQTVTALSESFDATCATLGQNYPLYWRNDNRIPPLSALAWNCAPLGGRYGTPGISCNGYYSGVYYTNEAWLFTPRLDLSSYNDHIYLRFDARYEFLSAKLRVLASNQYVPGANPDSVAWEDLTTSLSPIFTPTDSGNWVTHWADLTPYKGTPIYVAFKYNSTTSRGGRWTIDNVMTTTYLDVNRVQPDKLHLQVLNNGNIANEIQIECPIPESGVYTCEIFDMLGRQIYANARTLPAGQQTISLTDLSLPQGIVVVKISNGKSTGRIPVATH